MKKKTICLNMIVKNESPVIKRCLETVKHLIDYRVIVDTGSTDGTQDVIKEFLSQVPGELHERPWVNFGHNRNEAMQLAQGKGDYLLFIDADDRLVFSEHFVMPELVDDAYCIYQKEAFLSVFREHHVFLLIRNDGDFKWEGVLHEFLRCDAGKKISLIHGVYNEYICDGSRSKDPDKITKDIRTLENAIRENPNDSRHVFYLARTYWSIRDYFPAMQYFEKRAKMEGDPQEVYYSLLYMGIAQRCLNYPSKTFIRTFCQAYLYRPSRAEALYELARYYVESKDFFLGYLVSSFCLSIPASKDNLFVESWVTDWGAPLYFFICARQLGRSQEAEWALQSLRSNTRFPEAIRHEFKIDAWDAQKAAV